jgi:UDP-N-acetylmuramate--alanine ligase
VELKDIKKIYFVGIGGIGMSALARYFNSRDVEVHGYDKTPTPLTFDLEMEGMSIHYEEDLSLIPEGIDLVVYTPAVPASHKEFQYFKANNFEILKRAAVLGIISRGMKAIAIAGTHGKTSTSAITTHILQTIGINCTAFLGGIAKNYNSNYVEGDSEWVVIEADEFDRSFLHLNPEISAVLSMDADHLDIYGNISEMHKTFHQFVSQTNPKGHIFYKENLPLNLENKIYNSLNISTFGNSIGNFQVTNIRVKNGYFIFDVVSPIENIRNIISTLPGEHNLMNALVGIAIAQTLGADSGDIKYAMKTFEGIQRRFEFIARGRKIFIDDYAHHPSELNAAIEAARQLYPDKKLTGIFQPHLYSRTRDFQDGFAEALDKLDEIYLLDIYPAREEPIEGVSSSIVFDKMKNTNKHLLKKSELLDKINLKTVEVLMTLGAGDIDRLVKPLKKLISK